MTLTSITTTRELAHRRNDGLDIRLLWDSATDRVTVALHDAKTGDGFEVEVGPTSARWTCSTTRSPTPRSARPRASGASSRRPRERHARP